MNLWPLAATLVGYAFAFAIWDVGRRMVAARANTNDALEKRYQESLAAHEERYRKAGAELLQQMRDEIDGMSGEVDRCIAWTRTKNGEKPNAAGQFEPLPWQRAGLDERARKRKQYDRRSTT